MHRLMRKALPWVFSAVAALGVVMTILEMLE